MFTYSIKRAREILKFHVAVVQRRLRNVQNHAAWCTCELVVLLTKSCFLPFLLPSPLLKLPISLMVFMPNITTNHAITYTNQDDLVLDVIHQNYLTYGCHSQRFLKFHDFSLTNIKFPWQTEYITISLTVILGTHLFMLLASHLQCTWIDSSLRNNMQKELIFLKTEHQLVSQFHQQYSTNTT